ncbi:MAG: 5'/3'-nucleotidase SurE [Terriglobia bacterium]
MSAKRILITNDDGINAPGIKALEQGLSAVGEVTVIAPDREMSATSQSISLHTPLRIHRINDRHYGINGTPADSVILALYKILPQRPDLVVSGINPGGNLGENVVYSGTVGGANEGAVHGVPSFAISLVSRKDLDFSCATAFAAQLATKILKEGLEPGVCLNVNVPPGEVRGVRITRQSQKISQNLVMEQKDPRGRPHYWLDETVEFGEVEPDSDYGAVQAGEISVTPLQVDRTHYPSLNHISRWLPALQGKR